MSTRLDPGLVLSRPPYTDYSTYDKKAAVAQYHANGGNLARTAAELNLPIPTLRYWVTSGIEFQPETLQSLDQKMEKTVHKYIDSIYSQDLTDVPLNHKATAFGIVFDKLQLSRNLPTAIVEQLETKELLVVLQQALALEDQAGEGSEEFSTGQQTDAIVVTEFSTGCAVDDTVKQ